jgi:hypothetical protein
MKTSSTRFLALLIVAAAVLAGCGSSGIGDVLGGPRGNDQYGQTGDVRGTVESVNTADRSIVVNSEGGGAYNLRNDGDGDVVLYYDNNTTVEYQGQTYRPEDLERGDRIAAEVNESGSRLYAQDIRVLHDVTSGGGIGDDPRTDDLRGVVRYVDTRNRTLEIEPSRYDSRFSTGSSGVVIVRYDSQTVVEYQGRRYAPENLERGDEVEVDVRDSGGQLLAEQIVVVGENRATR